MPNLHTDERLLQALADSARRNPSPQELHSQRVSYIMGIVSEESGITRAEVEKALEERNQRKKVA